MARPIHFEILARDPERLTTFYQDVLGWTTQRWDGPQTYWLVSTGSPERAGIDGGFMHRHLEQSVINTLEVDSLDDALARVEASGGRRVQGPHEIPGVGTHAYCADPEGILFGLLQPIAAPDAAQGA